MTRLWIVVGALAMASIAAAQDRPRRSPLQSRVDAAAPGATIDVAPGEYDGDLVIDRALHLVGHGRPLLLGSGTGTVLAITAPDVVVEGFDIDGRGGGDLGRDPSGIHIAAPRAVVRGCMIRNTLFGIYLREAPGTRVEDCRIRGIKEKPAGEKGSGIHVWNTDGFTLLRNDVVDVRDGIYIQSSPHGVIRGNVARDVRYGLHYMYSDDNTFEDNVFERADAGTAVMYSRRLTFKRNQFLHNRGFASVGLLLKTCDDVTASENVIADNARGIFLEGSARVEIRDNAIAESDVAVVLFDSTTETTFTGNAFIGNLSPLSLVGKRPGARFVGNYWSDNDSPDLDGDGRSDQPYRLSSLFDHLRGNVTAADLFSRSLSANVVAAAERTLPVLDPVPVVDSSPLAHPPSQRWPEPATWRERRAGASGLLLSALALVAGAAILTNGRRCRATAPLEART